MVATAVRHPIAICVSKDGDARLLGHLDYSRLIERSLRRSGLPIVNSQGFNPRPRVSFTDALPVGVASEGEWITLMLNEDLPLETIRDRLEPALPECARLVGVLEGPAPCASRLTYRLEVSREPGSASDALTALLKLDDFPVDDIRRKTPTDARALLAGGHVAGGSMTLEMLPVEGRVPRPGPVLTALRALARRDGRPEPDFGVVTKLCEPVRRQGDDTWDDAAEAVKAAPQGANSSSTPARALKAG
ncbi:MAG: TIGR03936 family radical SAM-associated protein [Planctomycetota bacterium]|jgi:radical SAM-linked protein